MIQKLGRFCVVLWLAVTLRTRAEVIVQNSAYQNIVVSFSSNLQSENGETLVNLTTGLLEDLSQTLHKSIGISVGSVILRLPDTWDVSGWDFQASIDSVPQSLDGSTSDILVTNIEDSAFGNQPFSLQFGGCGTSGRPVVLPSHFLTNENVFPKGTFVAREWLKYRYGVFDENGFPGDELYPSVYAVPGAPDGLRVTDCSNFPLEYSFWNSDGGNCSLESVFQCSSHLDPDDATNATSSLMYYHPNVTNMESVCGREHQHNNIHPSKHNVLCRGRSIWDVLKDSSDFVNLTEKSYAKETIKVSLLKYNKPRVAIIFEDSKKLFDQKEVILFAIRRLLYDLRIGSQYSLYSYSADVDVEIVHPLSLMESPLQLPSIAADFVDEEGDPIPALARAVDDLTADDDKLRGTVILITGSVLRDEVWLGLIEKMSGTPLCLSLITFTSTDGVLQEDTCHKYLRIPNTGLEKKDYLKELFATMLDAFPVEPSALQPNIKLVNNDVMSSTNAIEIPHYPFADIITLWFSDSIGIRSLDCKDDEKPLDLSKGVSGAIVSYTFKPPQGASSCRLKSAVLQPVLAQVQVTTNPEKELEIDTWVYNPTISPYSIQLPVEIFFQLNIAQHPVQDAEVYATVKGPNEKVIMESRVLKDDGKGNPDITRGDGIYSGYVIEFVGPGQYTVTVTAKNDGFAKIGKNGPDHCCGSIVKSSTLVDIPAFTRTFTKTFDIIGLKPESGYPPSRILDLKIQQLEPLTLQWTAPGGEMDRGKAFKYELQAFCEDHCDKDGSIPSWIQYDTNIVPKDYGEMENITLLLTAPLDTALRFAVISFNENNLCSESSNQKSVFIHSRSVASTQIPNEETRDTSKALIGKIVGASAVALFLLFIFGIGVFFVIRRPGKESLVGAPIERSSSFTIVESSTKRNDSSVYKIDLPVSRTDMPVKRADSSMQKINSFPVLLYTHDQIKDIKQRDKSCEPLHKAGLSSKPWISLNVLQANDSSSNGKSSDTKQLGDSLSLETDIQS